MKKIMVLITAMVFAGVCAPVARAENLKEYKEKLPKWLELGGDIRHRYEWHENFDLNDAIDDDNGFNLWRTRLNVGIKPNSHLKFFYQFQDSRISHDSLTGSKSTYENWADHRQLWGEIRDDELSGDVLGLTGIGLKVGRQEFNYGSQRLIGIFGWSNVAQTFDAAKLTLNFKDKNFSFDVFGGGKTPIKSPGEMDDFYSGDDNDRVIGYYAAYRGFKGITIEPYVFNRDTQGKTVSFGQTGDGAVDDYTVGVRAAGHIGETPWDFETDAAKQFGDSGSLDTDAQMFAGAVGYTFKHDWKPRLAFEYAYASGDSDPSDGKRETFDNLYPTNHSFYGYIDFASLQNIHNYHFQLKASPMRKLQVQVDYHVFYLDTPKDSLYAANRSIKRATSAGADDFVGTELDLLTKYKANDDLDFMIGYSHFFAGDFLRDTGPSDDADFFYIQSTLKF
ncbi:MAG: hypothetical protein COW13_04915 [Candidatus Omnitrophica bacterium CG12_big_fil_rev_8_21_14_0_65_50_5]|nr:MAG: hypothetical protein COW13_04915 [Candidatus Omnitrophica bacterium CG12_big_fil_rev_8_21_14_0_65_50_5]